MPPHAVGRRSAPRLTHPCARITKQNSFAAALLRAPGALQAVRVTAPENEKSTLFQSAFFGRGDPYGLDQTQHRVQSTTVHGCVRWSAERRPLVRRRQAHLPRFFQRKKSAPYGSPKNSLLGASFFHLCPQDTTSFALRATSFRAKREHHCREAAQMNEATALPQMMLRQRRK